MPPPLPFPRIAPSEITPPAVFAARRAFIRSTGALILAGGLGGTGTVAFATPTPRERLAVSRRSPLSTSEAATPYRDVTRYNNFYEFGPDKDSPAKHAHRLRTRPWSLRIEGEVRRPQTVSIEDLLAWAPLEERIYRLRCVEGWSMVIPWIGFPLAELIRRADITGNARYVEFHSLADPEQMPHVRTPLLDWPYVEGLRLDEAMHPLTLLAVGLYGEVLPNQNGAPVRLVVPWKYGFKSAKSIVRVRFVERQPKTAWVKAAPEEYGFYSNVNPAVDHPRWSQAQERRIGEFRKRPTLPFNGYAEQVAQLYAGMDLRRNF